MAVNVAELQKYNTFLSKDNSTLRRENAELKQTVKAFLQFGIKVPAHISLEVPKERPLSWAEKSEHFEPLLTAICEAVVDLTKATGHAVHYDAIERWIAAHYPSIYKNMKQPSGTIAARARDLRRDEFLMTPDGEQAVFLPGRKLLKEVA